MNIGKSKDIKSSDRHVFLLSWSLTRPVLSLISSLLCFRLYQLFLHESKDVSAFPGLNNFLWHIEVGLWGETANKCKLLLVAVPFFRLKYKNKNVPYIKMKHPSLCWWSRQSHHFNMRSCVYSVVTASIPRCMVGVSILKGQSLCVSLETPSSWIKL